MTRLTRLMALAALVIRASAAAAQVAPAADTTAPARVPHVRGGDRLAIAVLEEAAVSSPTVVRLLAGLQQSDVIVWVLTGGLPVGINGHTRFLTAAGGVRHLRVTLKIPNGTRGLIATLGHELCHATEIASMPEVQHEASLEAAYRRVGVAMRGEGYFETDAAVRTGQQVVRELTRELRW